MNDDAIFSISVSLERVSKEFVNVSVPITNDVMIKNEDGTSSPDGEKIFARAVELGSSAEGWQTESVEISLNPVQRP